MYKKKLLLAAALLHVSMLAPISAFAQDAVPEDAPGTSISLGEAPGDVVDQLSLPNPFISAFEVSNAQGLVLGSENGRYIMRGVIFDMWSGQLIDTVEDLRASLLTIDLEKLGIDLSTADVFRFGNGPQEVTVFVDPLCPHCQTLVGAISADKLLYETYTFVFLPVPYLGEQSVRAVTALSCFPDRARATEALVSKDTRWMMANYATSQNCDPEPVMVNMTIAQRLGVSGVPFIIGPSGGTSRGTPPDLRAFLNQD